MNSSTIDPDQNPYTPIKEKEEIRFLRLYPGKFGDPITCDLEPFSLSDPPEYEALSYTWDKEDAPEPITIDGCQRRIRSNLDSALRHIRHEDSARVLWIDALCINQSDVEENTQMGSIYSKAEVVVIWLGADHWNDIEVIIDMIEDAQENGPVNFSQYSRDDNGIPILSSLTERRWFRRKWIIQEVMLFKRAVLHCGRHTIALEAFMHLIGVCLQFLKDRGELTYRHNPFGRYGRRPVTQLFRLDRSLRAGETTIRTGGLTDIVILVTNISSFTTSDPRDVVYALWGLATDKTDQWAPDYTKNVLETCIDLVKHSCLEYGPLDIICWRWAPVDIPAISWLQKVLPPRADKMYRFRGSQEHLTQTFAGSATRTTYRACGSLPASAIVVKFHQRGRQTYRLKTLVWKVDRISHMFPHAPERLFGTRPYQSWHTRMKSIVKEQDFYYTLIAGRTAENEIPSEEYLAIIPEVLNQRQTTGIPTMGSRWQTLTKRRSTPRYRSLKTVEDIHHRIGVCTAERSLVMTSNDRVGLAFDSAAPGDSICLLPGCSVPVILQPKGENYEFICDAYIHGIMEGELIDGVENIESNFEEITLV